MKLSPLPTTLALPRHAVLRIEQPLHARLRAERGSLWITIDGEPDDIALDPGDSFEFDRAAAATVSALDDAVFTAVQPTRSPRWRAWYRMVGLHESTTP